MQVTKLSKPLQNVRYQGSMIAIHHRESEMHSNRNLSYYGEYAPVFYTHRPPCEPRKDHINLSVLLRYCSRTF